MKIKFNRVGVFTNGNNDYCFDRLNATPMHCNTDWNVKPNVKVISDAADIYQEIYDQSLKIK